MKALFEDVFTEIKEELPSNYPNAHEIESALKEFCELYDYTLSSNKIYTLSETTAALFAMFFGLTGLALSPKENSSLPSSFIIAVQCLLAAISNSTFAILFLLKKGYFHSASTLTRTLYEQSLVLLAIIIDEEKRAQYLSNNGPILQRGNWKKHFSFKSLNKTLKVYEESLSVSVLRSLAGYRAKLYAWHSSLAHNGYLHILMNHFVFEDATQDNSALVLNIGGIENEFIVLNRLQTVNDILFYTSLLFLRLTHSKEGLIDCRELIAESSYEMWRLSQTTGKLAEKMLYRAKKSFEDYSCES